MKTEITPELIEKAKAVGSPEELMAAAAQNGVNLTEEEARDAFARLHTSGELSDEELNNVAGGGCGSSGTRICPNCGTEMKKQSSYFRKITFEWYECAACGYKSDVLDLFEK